MSADSAVAPPSAAATAPGRRGLAVDTIEPITIGGITQWVSLRAVGRDSPLILFLHGGPGTAQISFSRKVQERLHRDFVVVNWDQRGAGRSWSRSLRRQDMRIDRFVADAEELVEALLARFGQEQLFVVGQSWGSIVGVLLAAKRPDLVRAYVGVGQVVDMSRGEAVSYQFTLDEARRRDSRRAIRQLERIGPPPYARLSDGGVQRRWLSRFHGATYRGSLSGTVLKHLSLRDTRPLDVVRFVAGAIFSLSCLDAEQNEVDLLRDVPRLEVPVVFCVGRRDYTTPFELVVEYASALDAPRVEVVWFERSGHLPNFEEPERFCELCASLREVAR